MSSTIAMPSMAAAAQDAKDGKAAAVRELDFTATLAKPPPMSNIGLITFMRTYARAIDPTVPHGAIESWPQTIERVVRACNTQLKVGFTPDEQERLFDHIYNLRCSVAGRFLWQLGTKTVDKLGLASLQNCAFLAIDHPVRPFVSMFDLLMLGSGVGFSVQRKHIDKLPVVKAAIIERRDVKDADFVVPDNREGWLKLLAKTLKSHFYSGKGFTYSCQLLRSKGAPIASFGGVASGPDVLEGGIADISRVLNARVGQKARSIDILDVCNIVGHVVVSGNVRRSAQIALGDSDDLDFLRAKRWDLGGIPTWRSNSNNSVICDDMEALVKNEEFWQGYQGNGEPYGIVHLAAMKKQGRTGETQYPDPDVEGCNPCSEQTLASNETCCLAEIFLPNVRSEAELRDITELLYRVCKHSMLIGCHIPEVDKVVRRNLRMGLGATGFLQATEAQKKWLSPNYTHLRAFDVSYSAKLGVATSRKLTTVKPSGTLSLVAGVTPGIHPAYSKFYIRRIRVDSANPLVEQLRGLGHDIEYVRDFGGKNDLRTVVVSFPCRVPEGTVVAKDMTALDQLDVVERLQAEWSDNAVSCTIYYRKEELPAIRERLLKSWPRLKCASFLLHSEHGFQQAPYEEITEEQYMTIAARCKPMPLAILVATAPSAAEPPAVVALRLQAAEFKKGAAALPDFAIYRGTKMGFEEEAAKLTAQANQLLLMANAQANQLLLTAKAQQISASQPPPPPQMIAVVEGAADGKARPADVILPPLAAPVTDGKAPTPRSGRRAGAAKIPRWSEASAAHDSELLDDTECEGGSCPAR